MRREIGAVGALVALAAAGVLDAQVVRHDVVGEVRNGRGEAVAGAQVVVGGTGRSAVTDGEGRFVVRGVRAGAYRLHVASIGHAPAVVEVVVPGDAAGRVEVVLEETPLSLPGVQVTATPGGGDVRAVAQATTQLAGVELERRLAATLAQTLERQPGIAVRYAGPAAAAPVIRGLTGDRILVLQDGQRSGDLSGSAVDHAVTVDPLAAGRIEVVRGPAALLYGNNALGGVVNVVSEDIPSSVPARVYGEAGGQAESAYAGGGASARVVVPLGGGWAVSARGGARVTGDVRIAGDPALGDRLENSGLRSRHVVVGVARQGVGVRAGGALRAYGFRYGLPARPGTDPLYWEGRRLEATARAELDLPSRAFPAVRLDATAQDYEHDERPLAGGAGNRFELTTRTLGALLEQAPRGALGRGAWGASALHKRYTGTGATSLTPPADSRAVGLFGFQELRVAGGRAALQLGARVDRYAVESHAAAKFGPGRERVFGALSGSVGLVVPLGGRATASLTAARAFRAPTVEELFSSSLHAGTGAVEFGNPELEAERGLGVDAVLRVHSPRASGQLAAYHNRIAGYVYPAVLGDTVVDGHALPVVSYLQRDATLRGLEGSFEVVIAGGLVAGVGGDVIRADRDGGGTIPFLPPARGFATLRWDDGARLLGGGVRHAAARTRISEGDETPTGGYTLVDLEAGIRFRSGGALHSLVIRAENAGDALYRDATSRIKDFAPNPGRNVALLYRVRF